MIELDLQIERPEMTVQAQMAVPAHGVTAVIGRSGAGKSTLLHALAGLLKPARGRITLSGLTLFDAAQHIDLPPHRRHFGAWRARATVRRSTMSCSCSASNRCWRVARTRCRAASANAWRSGARCCAARAHC